MHKIDKSFDCHPPFDMKGTFLDVCKAFDKVWHEALTFKLKIYAIDSLLNLLKNYLTGCQERFVLNGQPSLWKNIPAGVP